MNRHHDQGKSYKKQHLIGAGLQVQRFSPLSSRWEHGNIQAGMAQEELRVLSLHPKAASGRLTSRQLGWGSYTHTHSDTPIPTRSHLFQQGHIFKWCHSLVQGYTNHHISESGVLKSLTIIGSGQCMFWALVKFLLWICMLLHLGHRCSELRLSLGGFSPWWIWSVIFHHTW